MVSSIEQTDITLLSPQSTGIGCQAKGCEQSAAFLFRKGEGPIQAFCESHAAEIAGRIGVSLPERSHRVLRAGFSF